MGCVCHRCCWDLCQYFIEKVNTPRIEILLEDMGGGQRDGIILGGGELS